MHTKGVKQQCSMVSFHPKLHATKLGSDLGSRLPRCLAATCGYLPSCLIAGYLEHVVRKGSPNADSTHRI